MLRSLSTVKLPDNLLKADFSATCVSETDPVSKTTSAPLSEESFIGTLAVFH